MSVTRSWPASAAGTSATARPNSAKRNLLRIGELTLPGKEETLAQRDERVEAERYQGEDQDRGEDPGGFERGLRLEHDEAEPGRGAGPFTEHRPDRGVGGRDPRA